MTLTELAALLSGIGTIILAFVAVLRFFCVESRQNIPPDPPKPYSPGSGEITRRRSPSPSDQQDSKRQRTKLVIVSSPRSERSIMLLGSTVFSLLLIFHVVPFLSFKNSFLLGNITFLITSIFAWRIEPNGIVFRLRRITGPNYKTYWLIAWIALFLMVLVWFFGVYNSEFHSEECLSFNRLSCNESDFNFASDYLRILIANIIFIL